MPFPELKTKVGEFEVEVNGEVIKIGMLIDDYDIIGLWIRLGLEGSYQASQQKDTQWFADKAVIEALSFAADTLGVNEEDLKAEFNQMKRETALGSKYEEPYVIVQAKTINTLKALQREKK